MPDSETLLSCSFCGSSQKQVAKLIAGPHGYICDGCVGHAHLVMAGHSRAASTPIGTIQPVSDEAESEECSFCGKQRYRVTAMASTGHTLICNECVELCDEIISEDLGEPRR